MGKKKKVMFLIPTLERGGAERVVSYLTQRLPEDMKKYVVLHDAKKVDYDHEGELIDLDLNLPREHHLLFEIFRGSWRLKKVKEKHRFDTSVSFLSKSHHLNLFSHALSGSNEKTILSVRNFQSVKFRDSLYGVVAKTIIKLFYNRADIIVTVSKGVKADLVKNFDIEEDKIEVIYNPCDLEKIRRLSKEEISQSEQKKIFHDHKVVMNVGYLGPQKGQWHLIRAFKEVKKEIPDAKLVLMGKGEFESYLKDLTEGLGLDDDVIFLGYKHNPFKYLSRSDVFALSSLFEGCPNVVLEAMGCGSPIVSTDCNSGPREILAPTTDFREEAEGVEYAEYGLLTPTCDGRHYDAKDPLTTEEKILARSIVEMLDDEELKKRYREASMERVKDFDLPSIINRWRSLI